MPPQFLELKSIDDEAQAQPTSLSTENQKSTVSDNNELSPSHQRNEPREIHDLIGHTYSKIPSGYKPVLTMPFKTRLKNIMDPWPEDLTMIEKIITTSEPQLTSSVTEEKSPHSHDWPRLTHSSESEKTTSSSQALETSSLVDTTDMSTTSSEVSSTIYTSSEMPETSSTVTTSYMSTSSTELSTSSSLAAASDKPGLSTIEGVAIALNAIFGFVIIILVAMCVVFRSRKRNKPQDRDNQNNVNIRLDNGPFSHTPHALSSVPEVPEPALEANHPVPEAYYPVSQAYNPAPASGRKTWE